jgi:hypothetical protein
MYDVFVKRRTTKFLQKEVEGYSRGLRAGLNVQEHQTELKNSDYLDQTLNNDSVFTASQSTVKTGT